METIQDRLELVIKAKSDSKKEFAEAMGWSQSYLSKILGERGSFGMQPLMQVLSRYQDISARWLMFGDGYMFGNMHDGLLHKIAFLGYVEKYLPAMNQEEVQMYIDAIRVPKFTQYALDNMEKWNQIVELRHIVTKDNYVEILRGMGYEIR